jgi:hypothetical protein
MQNYDQLKGKRPKEPNVTQHIMGEFDRLCSTRYTRNIDNKRWINLNQENPFLGTNMPPKDHLVPEKILEKPG